MDYLDPRKEMRDRVFLMLGYILIAVAISLASIIFLYQAYGFNIGKNGTVVQNSLTFFSSRPNSANLYINGKLQKQQTNTRLELEEGTYKVKMMRDGYHPWQRTIQINGGDVQHYDYPFLIPELLSPKKIDSLANSLSLATQSLDKRWLLVNDGTSGLTFRLYDLKGKTLKPAVSLELPANILSDNGISSRYKLVEWADDNAHVLLKHIYDGSKFEYILLDRGKPELSLNLTTKLKLTPGSLALKDRKYNQYLLHDSTDQTLQTATLSDALRPLLLNVISYHSYSNDTILYATPSTKDKVAIRLAIGRKTYDLKELSAGSTYLLDLASYNGKLYVVIGSKNQDRVYIYKDPLAQLSKQQAIVPVQVFHIDAPNRISFSSNAQYVVAEHGQKFGVYDLENKRGYNYDSSMPLDAPQEYATWMDGNRLTYTSNGKQVIFDYDYTNHQTLVNNLPNFLPMFSADYNFVYNLDRNNSKHTIQLNQTSLLAPADQ